MSQAQIEIVQRPPRRRLGALRHRNYRLFFSGQAISTVGTWMQSVAQSWLVLQLTHSALAVGAVVAAQFLPMLIAGAYGGVIADRHPKRQVLVLTQTAYMLPALGLFALAYRGAAQFWMVVLAALLVGAINVFDMPARQAFVIDMVGREDLVNAIALNSSVFNAAAVAGPAAAGLLISATGVAFCFLANGLSYLGAIATLLLMSNLPALAADRSRQPAMEQIREGAAYVSRDAMVGMMLVAVAAFSLFAMNRLVLIPLFADQVLHVGATGFGLLVGCLGLGALLGALSLALSIGSSASGRRQFWVGVVWVVALELFALSRLFWLSAALLLVAGYCQISFLAVANGRIQSATPDALRGRVMALYAQAVMGMSPVGSALSGILAFLFSAPLAQALGAGVAGVLLIAIRVFRPSVFTVEPAPVDGITRGRNISS